MSLHRYPPRSLLPDYGRGFAGVALSGGALALTAAAPYPAMLFGGLTGLFVLFTIRTAMRHRQRIEMSEEGIGTVGGGRRALAWSALDDVRLRHYATRRGRGGAGTGWMTLTLGAGTRHLAVESSVEGFQAIVERAARAAHANRLALTPATAANFAALGLALAAAADERAA